MLGARPRPLRVQRAEGGVGFRAAGCRHVLIALQRVEGGFSGITEADFHIPPAPATPKVAVFKQVEHGFTAGGKSPVVSLSLLIALCPRNLWEIRQILDNDPKYYTIIRGRRNKLSLLGKGKKIQASFQAHKHFNILLT